MTHNKEIMGMLENLHLLRKLFIRRISESSPLHFGQVAIMRTIEEHENCTQADIAEMLNVTPASVATSTKRLQKAGLITKTVDEENLRCKRLSLTDEGRTAIDSHISLFKEYDERVFSDFSQEEKEQLFSYLSRMSAKMQELEGVGGEGESVVELARKLISRVQEDKEKNSKEGDHV